jgi:hypothetical protein
MPEESHLPLRDEERARLEAARSWVKGHFTEKADEKYDPEDGKLRVIDAILGNRWVTPDETWKLQALGIAFGDALAQRLQLEWVTVDDEFGCDPALNWPGTSICVHPPSMILKRVESGEDVDVYELLESTCSMLTEMAFSGRYK